MAASPESSPPAPAVLPRLDLPPSPSVDRVMAEQRARDLTRRSIKTAAKAQGLRLAMSMVDLTTLEGADSPGKVRGLCRKALQPCERALETPVPPVAAVCVYPELVPVAADALAGSDVRIASVATGFPSGQYPIDLRLRDVRAAIDAGAHEIDMVIARGAFLRGDLETVAAEIAAVRQVCREHARSDHPDGQTHLKIILETGELETLDNVRRASDLAIAAATLASGGTPGGTADDWHDGAVFIKTSTGKVAPAATMPVTLVMLEAIRDHFRRTGQRVGMKPAGGIRTAKQALHYLVLVKETLGPDWLTPRLFRIGASSLANDLIRQILKLDTGVYTADHDVSES